MSLQYNNLLMRIVKYFISLRISFHEIVALFGFMLFIIIFNQLLSGTMLSFSLITEPMFVPLSREEEDAENMYTDDFFWLHERGVDLLVIFTFLHLFRKMYLNVMDTEQEYAWKSGVILFLLIQVVIFLGLVLCSTHLSDITLTIASNAFHTFCFFTGKVYWLIFTDQTINSDTLTRLAYLHYVLGFLLAYYGIAHGLEMHYDWKAEATFDGIRQEMNWFEEALVNELGRTIEAFLMVGIVCLFLYAEPEALHYELFMWGDVGMIVDVRFYGVAPHWYFRPYMGWLVACPYHYAGLLGLIFFFISFYFQPNLVGRSPLGAYVHTKTFVLIGWLFWIIANKKILRNEKISPEFDPYYTFTFYIFLMAIWYAFSYLPFGRFYTRLGGNFASMCAFMYIYTYLSGLAFRFSTFLFIFKEYRFIN